VLEKVIENRLQKQAKEAGGLCLKLMPFSWVGIPDRLVILPKKGRGRARIAFVETKAPGKDLKPLQAKRAAQLRALGCLVFKIDTIMGVDRFMQVMGI